MKNRLLLFTIFFFTLLSFSFASSVLQRKNQELEHINTQIKGLKSNIHQAKTRQQSLEQELKHIEIRISDIANNLIRTNKNLSYERAVLNHLNHKHQKLSIQLQKQQVLLGQQVRAAYMLGKNQYIKLLLNQKQPQDLSRFLAYYRYINLSRIHIINNIHTTLKDLESNRRQIQIQSDRYANLFEKEQQQNLAAKHSLQERKTILLALNRRIETKSQRLSQLTVNRQRLQHLINHLKHQPSIGHKPKIAFDHMKGKLGWPTRGPITKDFGYVMDDSGTQYNGIFIAAPIGQPVYAIYPGKVVFANWLRGVGLLVIIQHDKDYMTLYGHDHSILVKAGQYVKRGQEIATVGQSGGYESPGLFFQLRKDGRPLNPHTWCS